MRFVAFFKQSFHLSCFDGAEMILSLFAVLENEARCKWLFWLLLMISVRKVEISATRPNNND